MTDAITVYHNPGCSKSRRLVEILAESAVPFELYHYLEERPDVDELRRVMSCLGYDDPRRMIRTKELAAVSGADLDSADADHLLKAMAQHPELIERPIVIRAGAAAGRSKAIGSSSSPYRP